MPKDEFLLSRDELRFVHRRRLRRRIIAIAVLVFLAAGAWAGPHVRTAIVRFQARRHARLAFGLIDQRKWHEAVYEAATAYRLRPNEPEAIRAIARLLSRSGQGDALHYWKNLAALTPLTRDDLRDETTSAVKANDLGAADHTVEQLFKDDTKVNSADLILKAGILARENHFEQAIRLTHKVLENPAATRLDKLQTAIILDAIARNGGAGLISDPKQIDARLVEIANGNDEVSLNALVALAKRMLDSPAGQKTPQPAMPVEDLIARIKSHPLAELRHKLLAADLEISEHPDQSGQIQQRIIDKLQNGSDQELTELGAWLLRRSEYQRELDAIPLERASQARELLLERINALSALNRWDDLRKIVENEDMPLDPVIANMYLARCDTEQGRQKGADNDWQRAIESAAGNLGKLITLGDFAEKNGAVQVAATAYDAAAAASPESRVAQFRRLRSAYIAGDTKKVHAILVQLIKIWPNDTGLVNDEAYTRLLLLPPDTKPDSAEFKAVESVANKLMVNAPGSLPHRTLLALALLKQNRPYSAFALYRNFVPPPNGVIPSAMAVHAAVVAAAGQTEKAQEELKRIPTDKLLPEERALISNLPNKD